MSEASTTDSIVSKISLKDNPFVAPPDGRCIINDLPTELLSQIFEIGAARQKDDATDDDSDDESSIDSLSDLDSNDGSHSSQKSLDSDAERHLPFELLVTRICKYWRDVAVEIPSLWSDITVTPHSKLEQAEEYMRRAKGAPVDISLDLTMEGMEDGDEDDWSPQDGTGIETKPEGKALVDVLGLLVPHIGQWKAFELMVSNYHLMQYALEIFGACAGAPILETLRLYHYENSDANDAFQPAEHKTQNFVIFHNSIPQLKEVSLWGVHLDWKHTTFLANLHEIELTYHTLDVRPSYRDFLRILVASPQLHTLSLCQSGPAGMPLEWLESMKEDAGPDEGASLPDADLSACLPSVTNLVLAFLPPDYVLALVERIRLPNISSLALDFEQDEYKPVLDRLCDTHAGGNKSMLSGIEALKLSGLPCSDVQSLLRAATALQNLKQLSINFHYVDMAWYSILSAPADVPDGNVAPGTVFFPSLEAISITGLAGGSVRVLVEKRIAANMPLKEVYLNQDEDIDDEDQVWLMQNVAVFELFEGSDDEDDDDEDSEIEDDLDMDHDGAWTDEDEDDYDTEEEELLFAMSGQAYRWYG